MFSLEKKEKIEQAWKNFIINGKTESGVVRDVILESWIRSRSFNIDPIKISKSIISTNELAIKIQRRKKLIGITRPYMQNLYSFVKGSGFLVILCDEQGFILELIGDRNIQNKAKESKLVLGANRSEKTSGTNAIGTCLAINKPIQVWAEEHYYQEHHTFTCSAAPIHDFQGNILGCLDITGPWDKVHRHTLGMVVAAVDGIEKQMKMKKTYNEISLINKQLTATLESISEGIIVIDSQGIITQINELANEMIKAKNMQAIGKPINEFLNFSRFFQDTILSKKNVHDREMSFQVKNGTLHCTISATIVQNNQGNIDRLVLTLREMKSVRKLVNKMTGSQAHFTFNSIIGKSEELNDAIKLAKIASHSTSNVLLLGESGTGKELFAQAIHNNSDRKEGPFIAINCAALPKGLIESELFGYEGGSFTGARKEGHPGKFELANGGTLFLDEIGDMPMDIQASLLRVLQNKEILRIGGKRAKKIDVRIIAATNKNLEEAVKEKTFRNDLYYRLNVFSIRIPTLRERKQDIKELADYFITTNNISIQKKIEGIDEEVYQVLVNYDWPGNVRELENVIERAVNLTQGKYLKITDLSPQIIKNNPNSSNSFQSVEIASTIKTLELEAIISTLEKNNGNIKKTAAELGIGRRTLYRRLEKYAIDCSKFRK